MEELLPVLVVLALALESLAYFAFPAILARLALIPIKLSRLVELPPEFMAEMPDDASAGYRQSAKNTIDPARLTWPVRIDFDDSIGDYSESGGFCWLRLKNSYYIRKPLGLVKIRAVPSGRNVNLVVTWYPYPLSVVLVIPFFLATTHHDAPESLIVTIFLIAAIGAVQFFWGLRRMKSQAELVLEVIADSFCNNRPR